ncbi:hypothetical protein [Lentzea sp.]|uniref:hypothetical protein n=1 Tax=Lentzea sp. TaxID=56099 RepID=UPI002ED1538A
MTPRIRYNATELDNAEAATLARAAIDAEAGLVASMTEVDAASRELTDAVARWRTALDGLDALRADGTVRVAGTERHRVARRHAHEGPEDRRHRPGVLTWVLYAALVIAAIYDTWFFSFVLKSITNETDDLLRALTYLPGFLIAAALLVSGMMLARQVVRGWSHRDRAVRREPFYLREALKRLVQWRPFVQTRGPDDLPWPIWGTPLAFFAFIMVTFGVWATLRVRKPAEDGVPWESSSYPPWAVVMLFLLFTFGAIFVKIVEHNPWADSVARAEKEFRKAKKTFDKVVAEAEVAKRAHDPAWQRLRTTLDNAENVARRTVNQAWVCILERRAEHGLAGHLAPEFNEAGGTEAVSLFKDMPEPAVPATGLSKARAVLQEYDGRKLAAEHEKLVRDLIKQLEPPEEEPPQSAGEPVG